MNNSISEFKSWCEKHNKDPRLESSLNEYNKQRGWKSRYIGKEVHVNADNSIEFV